jgi:tRNA pseudouridine38-40 synthase
VARVEAEATEAAREERSPGILLTIAYDGRSFHGFAPQPGRRTLAGELLGAIQAVDPRVRELRGASRTDARVHARGQVVAFDPTLRIPPRGWCLALNRELPDAVAVVRAAHVEPGFNPRFHNDGKRYRYLLLASPVRDPFLDGRTLRVVDMSAEELLPRLAKEAASAVGTHDFEAFRTSSDPRRDTVRTLRSIDVDQDPADPRIVRVTVNGSAFMHNMMRILVGTLLDVAAGRRPEGAIARALASGDRRDAGTTAPAEGLYLEEVLLRERGSDAWPA